MPPKATGPGVLLPLSIGSLVTAMLAVQVLTIFILLILLVITFKPWLDATRMALLLLTHIGALVWHSANSERWTNCILTGMATAFTVTHSSFQCYTDGEHFVFALMAVCLSNDPF